MTTLLLLTACLLAAGAGGVGYWKWKSGSSALTAPVPPAGNYSGLRCFHYQLSDYQYGAPTPPPPIVAAAGDEARDEPASEAAETPGQWLASLADLLDELDVQPPPSPDFAAPAAGLPDDWAYGGESEEDFATTPVGAVPAEAS